MEKIEEISLGSKAFDYLRDHLSMGHTLSKCILQNFDLKKGRITTGLPENADFDSIYNFEWSILPQPPKSEWHVIKGGMISPKPQFFSYIEGISIPFLKSGNNYCVFEDANASPSDPWIQRHKYKTRLFFYQDEVYHVLGKRLWSKTDFEHTINQSSSLWNDIGVLTRINNCNSELGKAHETDSRTMKLLCEGTQKIIVGAYDEEGFLVWHRA